MDDLLPHQHFWMNVMNDQRSRKTRDKMYDMYAVEYDRLSNDNAAEHVEYTSTLYRK